MIIFIVSSRKKKGNLQNQKQKAKSKTKQKQNQQQNKNEPKMANIKNMIKKHPGRCIAVSWITVLVALCVVIVVLF